MLEQLYTSTKTVLADSVYFLTYIKYWDALLLLNGTASAVPLSKVFRDGTQCPLGTSRGVRAGSRSDGSVFWQSGGVCYGADAVTCQPKYGEILNPTWTLPNDLRYTLDLLDSPRNLYIHSGLQAIEVYQLSDGALLRSIAFTPNLQLTALLLAGDNGRLLGVHAATGYVALIDYLSSRVVWESNVGACKFAAYDLEHNLLLVLGLDDKIREFLPTARPHALSAPEFYPAVGQVERYKGYPVRARLTGEHGEPCAGYRVDWVLPVVGELSRHQSLTDVEGYAHNHYFALEAAEALLEVEATV